MSYNQFKSLKKNSEFFVKIKSKFKDRNMQYGEILIKGKSKKEIFVIPIFVTLPWVTMKLLVLL